MSAVIVEFYLINKDVCCVNQILACVRAGCCTAGRQEAVDATLAALEVVGEPLKSMAYLLVDVCAYAGTGNVLKIQQLLHLCSEHDEKKEQVCYRENIRPVIITLCFTFKRKPDKTAF